MGEKHFRYRAEEALESLREIILGVERTHGITPGTILPVFLSLDYGGFENSWHHSTVYFQCSVEYAARDLDDQARALQAIRALSEHVSANEPEWQLPTGRSVSHKWHRAPDGTYHLQVTEKSVFDSSLSSSEGPGGFSFSFGPRFLQTRYAERDRPRVGLLVSQTYRSRKVEN